MSISPRSTCWWSSAVGLIGVVVLAGGQPPPKPQGVPPFLEEFQTSKSRELPLFLDDFHARADPPVLTKQVSVGGEGYVWHGFWARSQRKEPLPAILLAYDDTKLNKWMQTNARHLASIGYAVLAVDANDRWAPPKQWWLNFDEPQRMLSACMRWLRGRADVLPNRLGVMGFGESGSEVLLFASSRAVQACVVYDTSSLPDAPEQVRGLRGTPVLAVYGADDPHSRQGPAFAKRLSAERIPCKLHLAPKSNAGFLGPPGSKAYNHDAAEDAWVAIYNFLEKHVEDARPTETAAPVVKSALTIADMMRAVNEPSGVRGALSRALETPPKTARQWGQVRADAALIAEMGTWLQAQTPPKGPAGHWHEQARAFAKAAAAIADAAERRDYAAAQQRLVRLAGQCAACHNEHR